MSTHKSFRRAFTLTELVVAIGIMGILAGITIAVLPTLNEMQRGSEGAALVQNWFHIAKQRALHPPRAPSGIRLLVSTEKRVQFDFTTSPPAPSFVDAPRVRTLQYIEQPDSFRQGSMRSTPTTGSNRVYFSDDVDFSAGYDDTQKLLWAVQIGDYLQVNDGDKLHKIVNVNRPDPTDPTYPTSWSLDLYNPYDPANPGLTNPAVTSTGTSTYKIIRAPRPLPGEKPLELPENVAIDLDLMVRTWPQNATNAPTPPPSAMNTIDIMFSPAGTVLPVVNTSLPNKIVLWVRSCYANPTDDPRWSGPGDPNLYKKIDHPTDETFVIIYTRTGLISIQPVDPTRDNQGNYVQPYSFALNSQGQE